MNSKNIGYDLGAGDQHRVNVFLNFQFDSKGVDVLKKQKMSALGSHPEWLPEDCCEKDGSMKMGGDGGLADEVVWANSKLKLKDDLYPQIRKILEGDVDSQGFTGEMLELTATAKNLVSGGFGNKGSGMRMLLTSSAQKRLNISGDAFLNVLIENIQLYLFRSGIGVAVISLSFKSNSTLPLSVDSIVEGVYSLCHLKSRKKKLSWVTTSDGNGSFDLKEVCQNFLGSCLQLSEQSSARLFSYTNFVFKDKLDDGQILMLGSRASRKFTPDYDFDVQKAVDKGYESHFINIHHFCSIEGGCTVVNGTTNQEGKEVEFLRTFESKSIKPVYVPISILAYHEYLYLMDLSQESAVFVDFKKPSQNTQGKLDILRKKLLNFRLYYRFSYVSSLTHHNEVYQQWRNVLGLNKLLQEVTKDVEEVESYLSSQLLERKQEMSQKAGASITSLLIFISILQGVSAFKTTSMCILLVSLLVSIAIGVFVWKFKADSKA